MSAGVRQASGSGLANSIQTDLVIIGAGPVALFAVFEAGHLGLRCHLIDSMGQAGGQCIELYPEKPIFDVPATPVCTGQELVDALLKQAAPFDPTFHFDQQASRLDRTERGWWRVTTSLGTRLEAPSVAIAAGVGSFEPRRLRIDDAGAYEGKSLHYSVRDRDAFSGKPVVITGGGDSALDWVLALEPVASKVTLVHRRDEYRAAPNTVSQVGRLVDSGRVDRLTGTPTGLTGDDGQLQSVAIRTKTGSMRVDCDALLAFYGLSPSLGPIKDWGLNLDRNRIEVNTADFESNVPGIFAIGDICSYPGKLKLLLSGFHEGALMCQRAFNYAKPDKPLVFRHTTGNTELQELLGVA